MFSSANGYKTFLFDYNAAVPIHRYQFSVKLFFESANQTVNKTISCAGNHSQYAIEMIIMLTAVMPSRDYFYDH